jgi:hypothetical protein
MSDIGAKEHSTAGVAFDNDAVHTLKHLGGYQRRQMILSRHASEAVAVADLGFALVCAESATGTQTAA